MNISPFHAMYTARELASFSRGANRLVPAYASANIEIFPYQIAAAEFALRSPYLKGVVLADEGSLGKTYEALLIISQMYFEGRDRILIIVPTPLLGQWSEIMNNRFSVPFTVIDNAELRIQSENPFDTNEVVLTTYDVACENAELIESLEWNISVFEEAHRLSKYYTGEHKTSSLLYNAVGKAFKLLLTATPMQNSIMDLYGLLNFIEEGCLGDADIFYKRYFRKPENYAELSATASRYCFRTLRYQVDTYVNIPNRLPVTADYPLSAKEVKLAAMVEEYLKKPQKVAFPKMDNYDLTLMFYRALSSSPFALCKLTDSAVGRTNEKELVEIAKLAADIKPKTTGKGQALLKALNKAFAELKKKGANRKVLIFTGSKSTLGFLHLLLCDKYKTLSFDGSKSTDYSVIKKFENEAEILITTGIAAEGFNLDFCSFVVNFDLPYNILTIEQRVMRCHRQGQKNDVVVLNFLKKDNFADVRTLELINKRLLQFDGIMGRSDDIVGTFIDNAELIMENAELRHRNEIETEYKTKLTNNEKRNTEIVTGAENVLFTTFTDDISEKVIVTPKYIKDRTDEINDKLWQLTKWFFNGKRGYTIDENTKTLYVGIQPQKVFTGTSLRGREYSISNKTLTVTSSICKNIIAEIFWRGIHDSGQIKIERREFEKCNIAYYKIKVSPDGHSWLGTTYYSFVGMTSGGQTLTDEECREIMNLPIVSFTTSGSVIGERDGLRETKTHELDNFLKTDKFINLALSDTDEARKEEIITINEKAKREKSELSRKLELLKNELSQIENVLSRTASITERVMAEKKKATASRELKKREQSLFMDGLKIDAELETMIQNLTDNANLKVEVTRLFVVQMEGI